MSIPIPLRTRSISDDVTTSVLRRIGFRWQGSYGSGNFPTREFFGISILLQKISFSINQISRVYTKFIFSKKILILNLKKKVPHELWIEDIFKSLMMPLNNLIWTVNKLYICFILWQIFISFELEMFYVFSQLTNLRWCVYESLDFNLVYIALNVFWSLI